MASPAAQPDVPASTPRRVLLIGNGPSALQREAGEQIDAFDGVVARFNEFRLGQFAPHVGTRTDLWITWMLFEEQAKRDYDRVLYSLIPPRHTWPAVQARYPHAEQIADETFEETRRQMGYDLPSSGAYAAMHFLRNGCHVVLYGFDFFQSPRHHYGDDGQLGYRHSPPFEWLFFRRLIRGGKVSMLVEPEAPPPDPALTPDDPAWQAAEYHRIAALRLAEIDRVNRDLDTAWSTYDQLLKDWRSLDTYRAELESRTQALTTQVAEISEQKDAVGRSWETLHQRNEDLQGHVDRLLAERDSLVKDWNQRGQFLAKRDAELADARALIARLHAANAELDARARHAEHAREQTYWAVDHFRRESIGANASLDQAQARIAELTAALAAAQARLDHLQGAAAQLQQRPLYRVLERSRLLPPVLGGNGHAQ